MLLQSEEALLIIATDTLINDDVYLDTPSYLEFWEQVKKELENL